MKRRWSMVIIHAALLLSAVFVVAAQATETRVGSMGGIGYYTRDNSNVLVFPGLLGTYPSEVTAELRARGENQQYSVGAHMPAAEGLVFGLYLNRPAPVAMPEVFDAFDNVQMTDVTDLMIGTKGQETNFGARLTIGTDDDKEEFGNPVQTRKQSTHLISVGVGASNKMMDVAADLSVPGASDELSPEKVTWSGFGLGVTGRAFLGADPSKVEYVPMVTFSTLGTTLEYDSGVQGDKKEKVDLNQLSLGLGGAANYHFSEGNLLVLGLEVLGYEQQKLDDPIEGTVTGTKMTFPGVYLGVESELRPWLTARMGGAKVYQKTTLKEEPKGEPSTETTDRSADFRVSFGLGLAIKSLHVDLAVNDRFLFDGPNFVSGSVNSLANRVSVMYEF